VRTLPHSRPWWDWITPRASVRAQLYAAAGLWFAGVSFLMVRGVLFLEVPGPDFHPDYLIVPVALVAVVLGVLKAHLVLNRYATKAVARIQLHGRACLFGFFGLASWALVAAMVTAGLLLRQSPLAEVRWGRALLSGVYLAVGTALLVADRIFWVAARRTTGADGSERGLR